jgi:predicted ester cyclase
MKKLITGMAIAACFLTACKNNGNSSSSGSDSNATALKRNKQTALNTEKAYVAKDTNAIFKDYAAGFKEYSNGTEKPQTNMDSIKASTKSFFNAFPDYNGENIQAFADSNTVIVTGDWSGTFKNEFMHMKPTGKKFKISDADIFTFNKEGKIISHRSIQSDATFLYALGVPMPEKK